MRLAAFQVCGDSYESAEFCHRLYQSSCSLDPSQPRHSIAPISRDGLTLQVGNTAPHAPPVGIALDYLTSLYAKGFEYSAMNPAHSAVSTVPVADSGQAIDKHPLVIRLLKGIVQTCTSLPHCAVTWDTDSVRYLMELSP